MDTLGRQGRQLLIGAQPQTRDSRDGSSAGRPTPQGIAFVHEAATGIDAGGLLPECATQASGFSHGEDVSASICNMEVPAPTSNRYTHGHHESVLRSHSWRTVGNSAGYLLSYLKPGMNLLDIGCGPGTITADLSERVAPGRVMGLDAAAEVLEIAQEEMTRRGVSNVDLVVGDVYDLQTSGIERGSFDVVHAHQVLQHVPDPVGALRAMGAACKPGGIVAARDSDYHAATWFPASPGLDRWMELYQAIARSNGGEPDAGRRMLSWARSAGFQDIIPSALLWCFATPEDREWWGGLWADRVIQSAFAAQARSSGLATDEDLAEIAAAWKVWAASPDGWYVVVSGEVLCRT
ncbi:MAG: class I SAM-dependent methyltransferase [Acidimicrobiales bacterium]